MGHSLPSTSQQEAARVFSEHRDLLGGVAYRILGSFSDTEDVVQESWLRWASTDPASVADPRAFLVRVATRLAIDRLRRMKARRESYIGPWLPEPLLTGNDVADDAVLADSVSVAMLVVLETLSPLERAVFVLREAFAFPYADIGDVLGRSESTVRQTARRARQHVDARRPRFDTDRATRTRVTERFLAACDSGDLQALMGVLSPDVTLVGDSGGRARGPRRPILGADKVARFILGTWTYPLPDRRVRVAQVNGGPGVVVASGETPVAAATLDVTQGRVTAIHLVGNPDKLGGLRPAVTTD